MDKLLVKGELINLYITFGEKWREHASLAQLHETAGRDEQSSLEKQIADAYKDCMDEVLIVMSEI